MAEIAAQQPESPYETRSFINVPFLNLMSLLAERAGNVRIRFGGNTQDYATVVPSLPNGADMVKENTDKQDPVCPTFNTFELRIAWLMSS